MLKAFKICMIVFLISCLAAPAEAKVSKRHRTHHVKKKDVSARSAILWNASSGKVYFSKNSKVKVYPASTTKVMTAMLALEKLPLDSYVTVSPRAPLVAPTKLNLRVGEQYLVRDLVYACLLKSANDAAVVLAEAVAGSQSQFVNMMNQKAARIGARSTRFANAHGLPSKASQFTTAKDMAVIFKEALKNPFFQKAVMLRYKVIYSKSGRRHFLKSHNKILFSGWKQGIYGKTGYTRQARSCFVGYFKKGNDIIIADVFGCQNNKRWDDIKWMIERYSGVNL